MSDRAKYYQANFVSYLPTDRDAAVLDIGCGFGNFLHYLELQGYMNLFGVEVDEERAAASRQRTAAQIDLTTALDEYLMGFGPGRFDLITLQSVVAHFPPEKLIPYLRAIRRTLADRGRLIVETFNASRWTGPYTLYNDITHHRAFTEYSLHQALTSAGFHVVRMTGDKIPLSGVRSVVWQSLQHAWLLGLRAIYLAERGVDRNPRILTKYLIAVCERGANHEGARVE